MEHFQNFVDGASQLFEIWGSSRPYQTEAQDNVGGVGFRSDRENLRKDWHQVGNDMKKAVSTATAKAGYSR